MTLALIILAALVAVGALCYIHYVYTERRAPDSDDSAVNAPAPQEECCGMHITCERDSLLASISKEIEYYDDEELDTYRGKRSNEYSDTEIEQFRDVLLTLLPDDIAGWGRSLQLRGIELPDPVREELIMIVAEERAKRAS